MKQRLRLGLIGTGVAAHKLYLPAFAELTQRLELVACTNRTRSKAVAYARRAGFSRVEESAQDLFAASDIDAVIISLPIEAQPRLILQGLRAGKAILSEKPIAGSVAQAKKLVERARKFSAPWMVGENYAFMSHVTELARQVRSGALGEVRLVEVRQINWMDRSNPYFSTAWRANPGHVGGFVVDGGVHLAHVVQRCFGVPVVLASRTASFNPELRPLDTALGLLSFSSGALGTWTSCFSARDRGPMLRALGTRANAELYGDRLELVGVRGNTRVIPSKSNSFVAQFAHFADVVLRGTPCEVTAEQALRDLQLVARLCKKSS